MRVWQTEHQQAVGLTRLARRGVPSHAPMIAEKTPKVNHEIVKFHEQSRLLDDYRVLPMSPNKSRGRIIYVYDEQDHHISSTEKRG